MNKVRLLPLRLTDKLGSDHSSDDHTIEGKIQMESSRHAPEEAKGCSVVIVVVVVPQKCNTVPLQSY